MAKKPTFIYAVCGDAHVRRVNLSIRFLKKFTKSDILVVKSRSTVTVEHDQVIAVEVDPGFNHHQASIVLKTSLPARLGGSIRRGCYIDSDVVAVGPSIDAIFRESKSPVAFAPDHVTLDVFSRHAVACGCVKPRCDHLRRAIRAKFGARVAPRDWTHWNGGVFVFDGRSNEFMAEWHAMTLAAFQDPYWKDRDQGTLAAAAWKLGLQDQPTLAGRFNRIVDPYYGLKLTRRDDARDDSLNVDQGYDLGRGRDRPAFLHLINGGFGRNGWPNWDDAARLLGPDGPGPDPSTLASAGEDPSRETSISLDDRAPSFHLADGSASENSCKPTAAKGTDVKNGSESPPAATGRRSRAGRGAGGRSPDNLVVHGMWIGERLSKLELLTIRSFLHHGHEFHLWLYDPLDTPLPSEVVIEGRQ